MENVELQAHLDNLPERARVFGAAQTWLDFMEYAHYDGWQLPPQHTLPTHAYRLDSLAMAHAVTSLYRPWSYGTSLQEFAYRAVPGLGVPTGRVADMQARLLQNGAEERVPTVLQTNGRQMGNAFPWRIDYLKLRRGGAMGPMVYQLGGRVLQAFKITGSTLPSDAVERALDIQEDRGFDGAALDLRDLAAVEPQFSPEWVDGFVARFAMRGGLRSPRDYGCSEVVVSLPSNAEGRKDTRQIMAGNLLSTRVGRLLQIIQKNVLHDYVRVTVHAPPATFGRFGQYRAGNKAVSMAIRKLFAPQRRERLRN